METALYTENTQIGLNVIQERNQFFETCRSSAIKISFRELPDVVPAAYLGGVIFINRAVPQQRWIVSAQALVVLHRCHQSRAQEVINDYVN